ncbi:uncharacterized protein TNCV_1584231 [Trichonephila clavipes]|nr:uncharacterized protein TNCV_1584211 [Trichonephila clavipes]GFS64924.1 uncharacterized protein TNCV_1584231 [Trichonephila clavipes]
MGVESPEWKREFPEDCLKWHGDWRTRYDSKIYLADNMLYKDQTIKITASCDVWMTKSIVSVATIVGYNCCHTPQHRIKEALDVFLGHSIPRGLPILPKLIWCSSG